MSRHAIIRRPSWRRLAPAVAAAAVLALGVGTAMPGMADADTSPAETGAGATLSGTGPFAGLTVSVSKTRGLVNEVVEVEWTGGTPTQPGGQSFKTDYLQLMQCWGDPDQGPSPDQCQFGAFSVLDTRGGDYTATRQLSYGALVDPLQDLSGAGGAIAAVPFRSVGGEVLSGNSNKFFDANTSNEITYGKTQADGSGQEFFEIQTTREAPGLGCAEDTDASDAVAPRSCWLVVVPRSNVEVDGSLRDATKSTRLDSSPLSASNWAQRIQFKLDFAPLGNICPLGSAERPLVGSEPAVEAVARWQPALCADGGAVYNYSQVAESVAQRQLASDLPGMALLIGSPGLADKQAGKVFAPVSLSGIGIALLVERQVGPDSSPEAQARAGQRLPDLNLTPRLVAKLLTQSYRLAVDTRADYLAANPQDMTADPEFRALNPAYDTLSFPRGLPDILTTSGRSDATALLWAYVAADPDARDFVAGVPDPWGMRVNPFYQGMDTDRDDFPKSDEYCVEFADQPPLCTFDSHPYASDFHEASRAVARGDTLARNAWDALAEPPSYKKSRPLGRGQFAMLAVSDTATAARYGLTMASLRTAGGEFVKPTTETLLKGYASMRRQGSVLVPDPATDKAGAYPLTALTYAVTPPAKLAADEARDYATFVQFVVTRGQTLGVDPGKLPTGYVPLPASAREQSAAAALAILKGGTPTPTPTPTPTDGFEPPGIDSGSGGSGVEVPVAPTSAAPTAAPSPSAPAVTTPSPSTELVALPRTEAGAGRLVIVALLAIGIVAALAWPLWPLVARGGEAIARRRG